MQDSQERIELQDIPIKAYRSRGRLTVVAPMPGLEPEDIYVEVTGENRLILHGKVRGGLKGEKELLIDEWSVGGYHREVMLPDAVDGEHANVTYGNGVVVVALPVVAETRPARLTLEAMTATRGEHVGNSGQDVHPITSETHRAAKSEEQRQQGGMYDPHDVQATSDGAVSPSR